MRSESIKLNNGIEILVAEDSPTQAEQLKHLLEARGYTVMLATNGKLALAAARESKPALVISDILMPEMDGYQLCKAIKADENLKNIPVILVTSLSSPQDVIKGLECGADNFIRKPYDEKNLLARLEYLRANRALRQKERGQMGLEIVLGGQRHFITSERQQILDLLISTYDEAIRLDEGLKRSNQSLNGLYRIAGGLNQAGSEGEVCEMALERAMELPGVQAGWIFLREGESGYRLGAAHGLPPALGVPGALEGECLCRRKLLAGELDHATNTLECERLQETKGDTRGLRYHASVPLWVGERILGLMNLVGAEEGLFSDEDLKILHGVGNQVGIALERACLREHLEELVEERTAALRVAEARYRNIIERLPGIAYLAETGEAGVWHYVSPQIEKTLGYTQEEWLADPSLWFQRLSPDDREYVLADEIEDWERGISKPEALEYRMITRDGRTIWVRDEASIFLDDPGRPKLWQGVLYDITERKRAEEEIQRQLQRITALRAIDMAITSSFDLRLTLSIVLDQVTAQLRVDAADVLLLDPHLQTLEFGAGRGFRTKAFKGAQLRLGEGYAGRAALERHSVHIPNLADQHDNPRLAKHLASEGFAAYYGLPLIAKGQVQGVLEIFNRTPLVPDPEWLNFLETLAGQAAIAVDNATLFKDLQLSNIELSTAYDATIAGWSHAMDLRDEETENHTLRVTEMTERLARAMGIGDAELVHIRRGGLLHDIGKIGVPDGILHKPGKLTDEEWVLMRQHPQFAHDMLMPIAYLRPAMDIPYCHHEKWDGTGYPRGLKDEQIPLAARIFAVVDVYDALTSDRPYRKAWSKKKTLKYIREQSGTHFDPAVADAFLTSKVIAPKKKKKT